MCQAGRQWGQVEGAPWGEPSGVRKAGSQGKSRGCRGVSCQVGGQIEGVPYCGAFVQVEGAGGGCQVQVKKVP